MYRLDQAGHSAGEKVVKVRKVESAGRLREVEHIENDDKTAVTRVLGKV